MGSVPYPPTQFNKYHIAQNCGGGKLWRIDCFRVFGEENVGEFTVAIITVATFSNLEFGWVKYWRMMCISPNLPKFSPATILHYTVIISGYKFYKLITIMKSAEFIFLEKP